MYNNTAATHSPQPIASAYVAMVWFVKAVSNTTGKRDMQNAKQMVA